jgi:hypothetical protein
MFQPRFYREVYKDALSHKSSEKTTFGNAFYLATVLFLIALYYDIISFFFLVLSLLHLPSSLENLSQKTTFGNSFYLATFFF